MGEHADDLIDSYYAGDDDYGYDDYGFPVRPKPTPITIRGVVGRKTEKAFLFTDQHGNEEWFPFSQTLTIDPNYIVVTRWIANQKGYT